MGGEPLDQVQKLYLIAKEIRLWGFTVVTYTSYTWEYLQRAKKMYKEASIRDRSAESRSLRCKTKRQFDMVAWIFKPNAAFSVRTVLP